MLVVDLPSRLSYLPTGHVRLLTDGSPGRRCEAAKGPAGDGHVRELHQGPRYAPERRADHRVHRRLVAFCATTSGATAARLGAECSDPAVSGHTAIHVDSAGAVEAWLSARASYEP